MIFIVPGKTVKSEKDTSLNKDNFLKIATFNIHFNEPGTKKNSWDKRKDVLYQLVSREYPDIIGFQEVYTHSHKENRDRVQFNWIKKKFKDYLIISNQETVDHASSLPILYKKDKLKVINRGYFFFTDTPEVKPELKKGQFIVYFCNWAYFYNIKEEYYFYVFNIHLNGRKNKNNIKSARIIVDRINRLKKKNDGLIITGDFNEFYNSKTLSIFYNNGLKNVINGFWPASLHLFIGLAIIPRIDHILINNFFQIEEYHLSRYKVKEQYPSDHYPIFTVLKKR